MSKPDLPNFNAWPESGGGDLPLSLCGAEGPSLMDLAAFLDGRIDDSQRRAIERHLTECPMCREAAHDFQQARAEEDQPLVFVPPQVIASAMALVNEPHSLHPAHHQSRRGSTIWMTAVRRGAAVAAVVAICFTGHWVGSAMSAGRTNTTTGQDSLDDAMSFGLVDSTNEQSGGESDLFALALTEAAR